MVPSERTGETDYRHYRHSSPHPLVRQARELFKKEKAGLDGMLTPTWSWGLLDIRASPQCLSRAFHITDMFLKGIEYRGYQLVLPTKENEAVRILANDEMLGIRVSEKRNRVRVDNGQRSWGTQMELRPSGVMMLIVYEPPLKGYNKSRVWEDGPKKGKIEDQMDSILDGITLLTDSIKQYRAYLEDIWRRQAVEEEKRKLEAEKRREEENRRTKLRDDARLWEECKRLRAFVDAVEQAAREQGHSIGGEAEPGRWVEWAREYIESIDPIHSLDRYRIE